MTDLEKANEICKRHCFDSNLYDGCMEMAEWKEQQMMKLWNAARNVYEAWMGGTMNDVRECMKDLGHVYDEFKDKGMY